MKRFFLRLATGFALSLTIATGAAALVQPAAVNENSRVEWSQVISDPFDGQIVYDKNFSDRFACVSSWAKSGIRVTYFEYWQELVGYTTVWRSRTVTRYGKNRYESYPTREPIYQKRSRQKTPDKIMLSINGQVYNYEGGAVSPDLATALTNAPKVNVPIRLVWADGSTADSVIGTRTVEAWKTIFQTQ